VERLGVDGVVRQVLSAHGVGHVALLAQPLRPRSYCVQYGESDLAFVLRLLAEEGLFFFFEHFETVDDARRRGFDRAIECLVIADGTAAYQPLAGGAELTLRDVTGALEARESDVTAGR
jgi:type VI secretion system secreted protein VgrG